MRRKNTTNEFLKECMADALFRLLKEKPFEEITITEITDLADVGRVTFYRNFTKKEDLIRYKMTLLKEQFLENFDSSKASDKYYMAKCFFSFIYEIREPLTILYQADLLEKISFLAYENTREKILDDNKKLYGNAFWAFGIMGIIVEWIQNDFKETPEELLKVLKDITPSAANKQ